MLSLARNGYTASQVDAALHSPNRSIYFRYNLLDDQNNFKRTLTNVTSSSIAYDTTQQIKRTAKFTLEDDGSINFLSDRIQPFAVLQMPASVNYVESTQVDFSSGTLTNAAATSSGLLMPFTYATTYSQSGSGSNATATAQAMTSDGSVTPPAGLPSMLKISTTTTGGNTVDHETNDTIQPVKGISVPITAGMVLDYWVYLVSGISTYRYSVQIETSDFSGTNGYQNFYGGQADQNGVLARWDQDLTAHATGQWYHRQIVLGGNDGNGNPLIGKTLVGLSLFGNDAIDVSDGTYVAYFAFSLGTRVSPSKDLSAAGGVSSSDLSWTSSTPSGTSVGIEVSTDDGSTWRSIHNGSSFLVPTSSAGSVKLRETLITNDPSQTPTLASVTISVTGTKPGGFAQFPLGVFLLSTPPRVSDSAQVVTRQVDAYDQLQILVDDKVTDRYSVTASTNYIAAVSDLLQSANITQTNLTTTALTLPTTLDWAIGTSKLKIISDLLTAINYRPLWFDANGMAIAQPYSSPSSLPPVYTYADDDESVILPAMTQTLDLFAQPNEWVLTVSQTDRASLTSVYTNTNATSPTSTVNRGRKIPKFISNVQAPDQATLDAMAQKMAYEDSQVYEQVQFESAIMPFHEDFEVLQLTYSTLGISDKYSEIAWSFDLKAGSTMKHTVQRQVSV